MPNRELNRLLAVDRFLKLRISKESELEEIARFAAKICNVPIALITLIDEDTQYFKVAFGTKETRTRRESAFCNYVIDQENVVVIPDTSKDIRFADNPLRMGKLNIQFYAGAPLITQDGLKLGSLCVIGHGPAELNENQQMMLAILSRQVIHVLEFDYSLQIMKEQYLEAKKNEITLRSIFESSNSCLMLVDLDLKVVFNNKVLSDIMKSVYNKNLKTGVFLPDIIGDDFIDEFTMNYKKARDGERVFKETCLEYESGQIWWQFTYDPAYDTEGNIIGVTYNATDISELKQSRQRIIERDQSLHTIALIQSHGIRKPVASILGLTDIFRLNNYRADKEEIMMLEQAARELDTKIREIVDKAGSRAKLM